MPPGPFAPPAPPMRHLRVLIAARLFGVRLIDNLPLAADELATGEGQAALPGAGTP